LSSFTCAAIYPCPPPIQASSILMHSHQPPSTGHEGLRLSLFGANHEFQPGERLPSPYRAAGSATGDFATPTQSAQSVSVRPDIR
jgi:hypothetical protein